VLKYQAEWIFSRMANLYFLMVVWVVLQLLWPPDRYENHKPYIVRYAPIIVTFLQVNKYQKIMTLEGMRTQTQNPIWSPLLSIHSFYFKIRWTATIDFLMYSLDACSILICILVNQLVTKQIWIMGILLLMLRNVFMLINIVLLRFELSICIPNTTRQRSG
jgi:hypothetical protein